MKRKKLKSKLKLNKEVITNLAEIKGGAHETAYPMCRPSFFWGGICQTGDDAACQTKAFCESKDCY